MKILITGSNGMLATQVITDLQRGCTELGDVPATLKDAQKASQEDEHLFANGLSDSRGKYLFFVHIRASSLYGHYCPETQYRSFII